MLGWTFIRDEDLLSLKVMEKDRDFYKAINNELTHQNSILKRKVDGNKLEGVIDVDIGDPTPDKIELRREYVAKVAGFYKDVFKAKLLQMMSVFHRLLEEETNDRETDFYLKVGIFICRDLSKWGEAMVSEQMSYQTESPPTKQEINDALPN